jgi:hypothetical protein
MSITDTGGTTSELAWIVTAEWADSSPTHYGPWQYAGEAEAWAERVIDPEDACTSWAVGILTPAPAAAEVAS